MNKKLLTGLACGSLFIFVTVLATGCQSTPAISALPTNTAVTPQKTAPTLAPPTVARPTNTAVPTAPTIRPVPTVAPTISAPTPGEAYAPTIDPANFVRTIDNPYFALKPGTIYIYEGKTEKGNE